VIFQLKEAKHINLSLHYLEAVIIALQQVRAATSGIITYPNASSFEIVLTVAGAGQAAHPVPQFLADEAAPR
jgi:hypothetical protein